MKFKDFMELYDNWNETTVVDDDDSNLIVRGRTSKIMFGDGELYMPNLMEREVVSFGFFNDELCVIVH